VVDTDLTIRHLASIIASSSDAILSKNLDGVIISWNAGAERMFGYSAVEMIGRSIIRLIPVEIIHEEAEILARLRAGERIEHYETVRVTKDGRRLDVSLTISPVHDVAGRVVAASKIIRDISERKRAEARIRLLMREVNHRSGNLLSVVQAVARQTVKGADPATFVADLCGRIACLAACQSLLIQNEWHGVQVIDLIRSQLLPFDGDHVDRVSLNGPTLLLDPSAVQAVGMALHELATNARQSGALADDEGRVCVTWQIHDGMEPEFGLCWRETGGLNFSLPAHAGFARTIIVNMTEAALGGRVTIDYRNGGFLWQMRSPVKRTLAP
jgi:PAS domain S-box-containing protein